ncbi:MAG: DUF22 domain-containing protein [Archaeoglobus sp.]|nr:DUF22 domain-containing protein [Archaeoglobus sp.]
MKVKVSTWADAQRSDVTKKEVEIEPVAYRTGPKAYWKLLIADEDVKVSKGKVTFVRLNKISIPGNTVISPLSTMRNEFGVVLDVYETFPPSVRIEEPKTIEMAAFLPVKDGEIQKGDLIGVVNVFGVNLAPAKYMMRIKPPEVEVEMGEVEANIVYGERKKARLEEYNYHRRGIAEWIPLVAENAMDVKAGEAVVVDVREAQLPSQTIPVPLSIMRHPLGTVVDVVAGKLKKIEVSRVVNQAIFVPCHDGRIEKGDLIGILNNYYISIGGMPSQIVLLGSQKANIVFEKDGKIIRREHELKPFGYKESDFGIFEPVIAAEDTDVKPGEVVKIKVEEINLPTSTLVQPLAARNHALGVMLDIVGERPALVEEDKKVVSAVFLPTTEGKIEKGDLIGVLNIYHVAVMTPSQMVSFGIY